MPAIARNRLGVSAPRRHLADRAGEEDPLGQLEAPPRFLPPGAGMKSSFVHDGRKDRPRRAEPFGDLPVGERERPGVPEERAGGRVPARVPDVVECADDPRLRSSRREERHPVVVRRVRVEDVELLSQDRLSEPAGVGKHVAGSPRMRDERPRPSERQEAPGEQASRDESELRFHARRDEGRGLVEDHGRRTGPFLARHQVEDAHGGRIRSSEQVSEEMQVQVPGIRCQGRELGSPETWHLSLTPDHLTP